MSAAEARPAATVVLVRPGPDGLEVLLTRRPSTMRFAADVDVFPGGAVDPGDADVRAAAVRELAEETAVTVDPAALVPLSRWVTPAWMPRRFDTRFFAAMLPAGVEPAFDPSEVVAHRWITPRDALRAATAGELALWPPTEVTLRQLEHVRSFGEIASRLAADGDADRPIVEDVAPEVVRIAACAAGGVPGQAANTWLVGPSPAIVVDPGDPAPEVADAIVAAAAERGLRIGAIVLTHDHPDHAAGVVGLAELLGVPVVVGGAAAASALPAAERVRAHRTPGHAADHLAIELPNRAIVLSGDLVGAQPTRSVLAPPDPAAWLASLDVLERLAPARMLPGHGRPIDDVAAAITAERDRLDRLTRAGGRQPGSG